MVYDLCARNLDNRQYDYPLLAAFQSETNGKLTVSLKRNISESYLFVNNGSILQSSLDNAGKKETWLLAQLKKLGYEDIDSLFCVEWTPGKGFYIAAKNTDSHKSGQAHSDNDISN